MFFGKEGATEQDRVFQIAQRVGGFPHIGEGDGKFVRGFHWVVKTDEE